MKIRATVIVSMAMSVVCASGCTTAYRNAQLCKQKMVATYPANQPALTYSVPHASLGGTRVVVEATHTVVLPKPVGITPLKIKSVEAAAAVECTFDGETLKSFAWLAPPVLALRYPLPATP
jgi:hypothetical protein